MHKVRCSAAIAELLEHPDHPGITEADCFKVLGGWAVRIQDDRWPWRWYATGRTDGKYEFLTVVYIAGTDELVAITAYPAGADAIAAYRRAKQEGAG
jgi:hypothetical protein